MKFVVVALLAVAAVACVSAEEMTPGTRARLALVQQNFVNLEKMLATYQNAEQNARIATFKAAENLVAVLGKITDKIYWHDIAKEYTAARAAYNKAFDHWTSTNGKLFVATMTYEHLDKEEAQLSTSLLEEESERPIKFVNLVKPSAEDTLEQIQQIGSEVAWVDSEEKKSDVQEKEARNQLFVAGKNLKNILQAMANTKWYRDIADRYLTSLNLFDRALGRWIVRDNRNWELEQIQKGWEAQQKELEAREFAAEAAMDAAAPASA
eukprot:TRINITY_DN905_c0_g1_i3.p1 TRINITY_DN905_c0_g1~~TRINITY_DN905_c0_g1_i3.p1  ORF type:complete len:266 (+),score=135.98 TRINITY_DN905_c0_g1_i3:58-855(+)